MTFASVADAVADIRRRTVDDSIKGIPLGTEIALDDVGAQGWDVSAGDLALPVTTLSASAVESNLRTMRSYAERHGARLAPHGKTTMSPQLFARQIEHGAWAITAATPTQVAVMLRHGVKRVILANEMADAEALRWISSLLDADPELEFFCLVDDVTTVATMTRILQAAGATRPVSVLLEVGVPGGRCGVRDHETAMVVASAVHESSALALAGVEAYEGLVTGGDAPEDIAKLDAFFALMRDVTEQLLADDTFDVDDVIVTAGGSSYFDRVVAGLSGVEASGRSAHLVIRSGCYISHDGGKYEKLSPLAGRAPDGEELHLVNALTAWGSVLSRPEPDLVIIGIGKRDVAFDLVNPMPRTLYRQGDGTTEDLSRFQIARLMDQHAFMVVSPDLVIEAGDVVAMDMSHPCTAFDKARVIPLIDDDNTVVDAVMTFF